MAATIIVSPIAPKARCADGEKGLEVRSGKVSRIVSSGKGG
jgi:hypothetical protein